MRTLRLPALLFTSILIAACGGGGGGGDVPPTNDNPPPTATVTLNGVGEKGPFASGSSVTIHSLTAAGQRNQQLHDITASNDLGAFSAEIDAGQNVEIEFIGQFFDEIDGSTPNAALTLRAIIRAGSGGTQSANVNLLTHLAGPRHRNLIADSTVSDSAAETQARSDILTALEDIVTPPPISSLHSISLYASSSSNEASAYLVTLSALFNQAARENAARNGTGLVQELQDLLDSVASDLADGTLDDQLTAAAIRRAAFNIRPSDVDTHLLERATGSGSSLVPGDLLMFLDSDADGIVNRDDTDDDNDGVADTSDAYPLDWSCYLAAQGDGTDCQVDATIPVNWNADIIVEDELGVLHILDAAAGQLYRWSMDRQKWGWTVTVPAGATRMTYVQSHDRLYLGYATGEIHRVDAGGDYAQASFLSLTNGIDGLAPAGDHLFVSDTSHQGYTYSFAGALAAERFLRGLSGSYAWNSVHDRLYFLGPYSTRDLEYVDINALTGTFDSSGSSPYSGVYAMTMPVRVNPDDGRVITGAGDVFDGQTLTYQGSIPGDFVDLAWLSPDAFATIHATSNGTRVQHTGARGNLIEFGEFSGTPLRVFGRGTTVIVITRDVTTNINVFALGGDEDGDAVANTDDAFPLDPAASQDSDGDGFPDAWNAGMSAGDSTTGLTLDSYPTDSICYLPGHGDGTNCNVAANIPLYTPDWTVADASGTVYLLSSTHRRIYRWDPASGHLNPLVTYGADTPQFLRYSPEQDRLYVSYVSGRITYRDAQDPENEQHFAATATPLGGMQPVGNFLWAAGRAAQTTALHTMTFAADGSLTSILDTWSAYSQHSAWNPQLERVYFFRDAHSPNDVQYQTVDQVTGALGQAVDSPYHGDFSIIGPIRVSVDGGKIMLGNGDIYDAGDLTWLGSIPGSFVDGLWLEQDGTLVMHDIGASTQLRRRNNNGDVVETADFSGAPIAILKNDASFTVVTTSGSPLFNSYTPSSDSDGDGVENTVDAFPLDVAASVDTDGDGYPDAWNTGMSQADSTTGLQLDAYPNDAACYLPDHGDGTTCDITATMPNYVPQSMALDDNGILYLFSPENRRVYRRDANTGDHLNPYIVGNDKWLESETPSSMVLHRGHNRLYLSYDNGDINYIDLAAGDDEARLATAPGRVGGMADVGNFLLVQDDTGAWNSHHIYDQSGGLRDSQEWNRYSRVYEWNDTLNRVYFFRDRTSPNDLHYEEIDQSTGEIVAEGETPYHGGYSMRPPIRVSLDDSMVLLGGGDIFDANDLAWLGAIPGPFLDARWDASGGIVTLDESGGNSLIVRIAPMALSSTAPT